jgi:hypothetical protein
VTRVYKTLEAYFEEWPEDKTCNHEFIWYVTPRLTMEQWIKLDDEMGDAFERAGISLEDVVGVAGPIPFEEGVAEKLEGTGKTMTAEEFFAELGEEEDDQS